jgi:lipoprotein signal peptidase
VYVVAKNGTIYSHELATGASLWSYEGGANSESSPVVVGDSVYYGTAALFLTAIYWVGGIWVATFVHMYYNTHQDELEATSKKGVGAVSTQDKAVDPAPSQEVELPRLDSQIAALQPLGPRTIIVGDSIQNRILPLIEEVSPTLTEAQRRNILAAMASGSFLGTGSVSVGFETSDAAVNLKRELQKRRKLSVKRFNQAVNNFIEELPPQMLKAAVGSLLTGLEIPISTYLGDTQKAQLPAELEAYRQTLEEQIVASLGSPVAVHVFSATKIMGANPNWGWPLIRVAPDGKTEMWLAERVFYAMRQQEPNQWGGRLAQLTLAALQAKVSATVNAVNPKQFNELGALIAESVGEMEAHQPWFKKLRTYFIWTVLSIGTSLQALPMIKLLLVSPAAFPSALAAKWGIFTANFAVPGLLLGFLGALAIDWATKILINREIVQVDHRESYKLQWKTIKLGIGDFSIPFPVTNLLHWVHGPRRVFTLILPIAVLLAGINLTANPVFAGILLGGAIGNMVEVLLRKGATDWIPLPFGIANAADFAIVIGILGPWILAAWHLPLALAAGFSLRFAISKTINLFRSNKQASQTAPEKKTAPPAPKTLSR